MLKTTVMSSVAGRATAVIICALLAACGGGGGSAGSAGSDGTGTGSSPVASSPAPSPDVPSPAVASATTALTISAESEHTNAGGRTITLKASGFSANDVPRWKLREGALGSLDRDSGAIVTYTPPAADALLADTDIQISVTSGQATSTKIITVIKNIPPVAEAPAVPPQPSTFSVVAQSDRTVAGGAPVSLTAFKSSATQTVAWSLETGMPGSLGGSSGDTVQYIPPAAGSVLSSVAVIVNASVGTETKKTTIFLEGTQGLHLLAGNDFGRGAVNAAGKASRFQDPYGVARDAQGNLYVADGTSIRKITPEGAVATLAGTAAASGSADGNGTSARFNAITDMAIDASGNVYVTDSDNHTIRKVTPAGTVSTLAGAAGVSGSSNGLGGAATFNRPSGIAVDAAGNVYVSDTGNMLIRKITPTGMVSTFAQDDFAAPANARLLAGPKGIALDAAGNLYVVDQASRVNFFGSAGYYDSAAIRKITPQGAVSTLAGLNGMAQQGGDEFGSRDGNGTDARFKSPTGIAADASGNLYVTDSGNFTIRKVTQAGVVSTLAGTALSAGSADGNGSVARFFGSRDITADPEGNLYIAESFNKTVRKLARNGDVITIAGTAPSAGSRDGIGSTALFDGLQGIVSDTLGNFYVADKWNHTVRKITPSGEVTTFAGVPGKEGTSTDLLQSPKTMAIDAANNVYVGSANVIKKIFPTGKMSIVTLNVGAPEKALASGADGTLYTTSSSAEILKIVITKGTGTEPDKTTVSTLARLRTIASALATDTAGNVYAYAGGSVMKITGEGVVTTLAAATIPQNDFWYVSMTTDLQNNLYVAYSFLGQTIIQKIAPTGSTSSTPLFEYVGDEASSKGNHLHLPNGIVMSDANTMAITVQNGVFLLKLP